jgi:hypothetical protein
LETNELTVNVQSHDLDAMSSLEENLHAESMVATAAAPESLLHPDFALSFDSTPDDVALLGPPTLMNSTKRDETAQVPAAVSLSRKQELLVQARTSRLQWIDRVSLPYKLSLNNSTTAVASVDQHTTNLLASTHAGKQLGAAMNVLLELYNNNETELQDRIAQLLVKDTNNSHAVFPTGSELLQTELAKEPADSYNNDTLADYALFWKKLRDPAAAMLVNNLRNACFAVSETTDKEQLARAMQDSIDAALPTLTSHVVFRDAAINNDEKTSSLRRSLESFFYGQCNTHLQTVLWEEHAQRQDAEWQARLESFQFLTAKHLEIPLCQTDRAVAALAPLDAYYAPREKLHCILDVYRAVNEALTGAMNTSTTNTTDDSGSIAKKLPSADDVLPAIILTVIRARSERLLFNLKFVEDFCAPEDLRGEAGYAFTNLHGAVQFLQELDDSTTAQQLAMSAQEFRQGVEACRATSQKRIRNSMVQQEKECLEDVSQLSLEPIYIPPTEIRKARFKGEELDLEWARQWHAQQSGETGADISALANEKETNAAVDKLVPGFVRSYTFLSSRPEDIKLSDLSLLLQEYKMLVRTTETLLSERAMQAKALRKAATFDAENELYSRVCEVLPSLLPSANGIRKATSES